MNKFSIVHLSGNYWCLKSMEGAHFSPIAYLNTVCWGEFSKVKKGIL